MDKLNETSADSVMSKPADAGIPNDGTGNSSILHRKVVHP
jgi:hypothetical protein